MLVQWDSNYVINPFSRGLHNSVDIFVASLMFTSVLQLYSVQGQVTTGMDISVYSSSYMLVAPCCLVFSLPIATSQNKSVMKIAIMLMLILTK